MSCFKILVLFVIAECCGHRVFLRKEIEVKHDGKPFQLLAFIHGKWMDFAKIANASLAIQKRELVSGPELPPVEEKPPAPTFEIIEEKKQELPTFFGFIPPEPKPPGPTGLNTNILEHPKIEIHTNIQQHPKIEIKPIPVPPEFIGEFYGGLPPVQPMPPIKPVPAEPIPTEVIVPPPVNVPAEAEPPSSEAPPPPLFDKTKVRQYAVYAGDVILKYFSQFFNRARLTFKRITSPPPEEPAFEN